MSSPRHPIEARLIVIVIAACFAAGLGSLLYLTGALI